MTLDITVNTEIPYRKRAFFRGRRVGMWICNRKVTGNLAGMRRIYWDFANGGEITLTERNRERE